MDSGEDRIRTGDPLIASTSSYNRSAIEPLFCFLRVAVNACINCSFVHLWPLIATHLPRSQPVSNDGRSWLFIVWIHIRYLVDNWIQAIYRVYACIENAKNDHVTMLVRCVDDRFMMVLVCLIFSVLSTIDNYMGFANQTLFWMVRVYTLNILYIARFVLFCHSAILNRFYIVIPTPP